MNKNSNLNRCKHVHFVGVGGMSMSGLCKYFLKKGKTVSGSDKKRTSLTEELESCGVKVFYKHKSKNVKGADAVIYSSAVSEDNAELLYAKAKGVPIYKRSEALNCVLQESKKVIAVSGSHGKTTTTAMIAEIFFVAKQNPTVLLGGETESYGNCNVGDGSVAIVEACEYKKNFLDIKAQIKVILNIDNDHLDCYKDIEGEIKAFSAFADNSVCFVCADDVNAMKADCMHRLTFSMQKYAYVRAKYVMQSKKGIAFTLYRNGIKIGRIKLKIKGKHNVYNALAAASVCFYNGITFACVKKGLENFGNVKRRNEVVGEYKGIPFFADYAHHPTEIEAVLSDCDEKSLIVFQPHTYSRTKKLMSDFVKVLAKVKNLIIIKTYAAREKFDKCGSAESLHGNLIKENSNAVYIKNDKELFKTIEKTICNYNKVLFIGAGDVYEKEKFFLKKFVK